MNSTFFTENEDLYGIVSKKINNIDKNFSIISSGWTNIVVDVISNNENFIIKLPRDQFWSDCIEKDAIISNFISQNFNDFKTANAEIFYDNGRPFIAYKKIEGITLTEVFSSLTEKELEKIAKNVANIFYEFHSISIDKLPDVAKNKFYDFITKLPKINEEEYDFSLFDGMLEDEKNEKQVFIHGDLNIGNILLDKNKNITAIIDYAFSGISDIYTDLARISCRTSEKFLDIILKEYEKITNIQLNMQKIENRKKMWAYIESEYMKFMKQCHPEIKF